MKYFSIPCVVHIPVVDDSEDELELLEFQVPALKQYLPEGSVILLAEDFCSDWNETDDYTELPGNLRDACPSINATP